MIAQGLLFSDAKDLDEIQMESTSTGASNAGGVGLQLLTNNSKIVQDKCIVSVKLK